MNLIASIIFSIILVVLMSVYLVSRLGWLGATWFVFLILLIQGIRERNKIKIIVSAIIVSIPIVLLGMLFITMIRTSL